MIITNLLRILYYSIPHTYNDNFFLNRFILKLISLKINKLFW